MYCVIKVYYPRILSLVYRVVKCELRAEAKKGLVDHDVVGRSRSRN